MSTSGAGPHLDRADHLTIDVESRHAVLQHSFAHNQHQVVPLSLGDEVSTAEASTAGQDLIEGGLLTEVIHCEGREEMMSHH